MWQCSSWQVGSIKTIDKGQAKRGSEAGLNEGAPDVGKWGAEARVHMFVRCKQLASGGGEI